MRRRSRDREIFPLRMTLVDSNVKVGLDQVLTVSVSIYVYWCFIKIYVYFCYTLLLLLTMPVLL